MCTQLYYLDIAKRQLDIDRRQLEIEIHEAKRAALGLPQRGNIEGVAQNSGSTEIKPPLGPIGIKRRAKRLREEAEKKAEQVAAVEEVLQEKNKKLLLAATQQWCPTEGDEVEYHNSKMRSWELVTVSGVSRNVGLGEEPEVSVRLADDTVRDTTLGRLRPAREGTIFVLYMVAHLPLKPNCPTLGWTKIMGYTLADFDFDVWENHTSEMLQRDSLEERYNRTLGKNEKAMCPGNGFFRSVIFKNMQKESGSAVYISPGADIELLKMSGFEIIWATEDTIA